LIHRLSVIRILSNKEYQELIRMKSPTRTYNLFPNNL
jgi:hypothetical protein